MSDERKLATVLFADIVGSTGLTTSMQPEVLREMLSRTFARLSEILRQYGGTVEKFIGDEVMAVFGAPVTHDDDADRAVRAAFALIAAVEQMHESAIRLRIGLNTGEVLAASEQRDQFLVSGEPVVAAARLRGAAEPGEILVGSMTRRLTEPNVRYGRRRQVKAKGLGLIEASVALELASALPEQRRGVPGLRAPLIGRDDELRQMRDVAQRVATEGRAALVTIFGPAGSGKSRLTREFIAPLAPARVLRGRCLPYGDGITFWPVQEMVRGAADIVGDDSHDVAYGKLHELVVRLGEVEPEAESISGRLAVLLGIRRAEDVLGAIDGAAARGELRWALRRLLDRLAHDGPLTLVFEDIHWAEPSLLDVIEHLVDVSKAPLCVVCLSRPDLLATRPAWGGGKRNATMIELSPLTSEETRRLIGELLAIDDLPDDIRTAIVERAEGNPLYVEEFLRLLIDSKQVERRGGKWTAASTIASLSVPPTLHGLIAARLDRLEPDTKAMLQAGAVTGRTFWTDALSALQVLGDTAERLDDAVRRDLILEVDERGPAGGHGYRFRHVLIRDVAYGGIHKAERVRLHDALGRWLETAGGDRSVDYSDVIAHHAEQAFLLARELGAATAADLGARAFTRLEAAIARARAKQDRPAVLGFCERALAIVATGCVEPARGSEISAIAALTRWLQTPTLATTQALEATLEPLRAGGSETVLIRGLLRAGDGYVSSDLDRTRALHAEALERARALGDPAYILEAMRSRELIPWLTGDEDERLRLLTAAQEYVDATGLAEQTDGDRGDWIGWSPLRGLAQQACIRGHFARAREYADALTRLAALRGSPIISRVAEFTEMFLAHRIGENDAAIRSAEGLLAFHRDRGDLEGISGALSILGDVRLALGDAAGARAAHREALDIDQRVSTRRGMVAEDLWRLSAEELALGDLAAASELAELARTRIEARDVYSEASTRLQLARVRAAQGRDGEAETLFREAIHILAGSAYASDLADARCQLGAFLCDRGRADEARTPLEQARDFYSDPLAHRKREHIDALLARAN